jgi:type I restriction enzyme R subunit
MLLSERDTCTKFITPAIVQAEWDVQSQVREEVSFTRGRVIVRGKTVYLGKAKRADYILFYKPNVPLAVIEAKDNNWAVAGPATGSSPIRSEVSAFPLTIETKG